MAVPAPATTDAAFAELLAALAPGTRERALAEAARDACEQERRQAAARADAARHELEGFGALVSHDLRAPLRSIEGFGRVLAEDHADQLDADGQRYLGFVRDSTDRLRELIDELVALWKVARCDLAPRHVDLTAIARDAIARRELLFPARKVDATVEEGLACEADPVLLSVLVDRLVDNAWKFTGKKERARIDVGRAALDPAGPGAAPVFFVRDDGAGFDPAFARKLFAPFQRLHSTSEFEGNGAGLAMVQRIVARHGGRVWAEGVVDGGATVYFTLRS